MSSDIRDVLDLPERPPSSGSLQHPIKKTRMEQPRKLDSMQRELYSLLGENTPPVAVFESKFKERPTWKQKASPWSWAPFKNSARKDELVLHHWIRGKHETDDEEYSFAKYDQRLSIPQFSEEDYNRALSDSDWTYEETKYLFDLCQDYELRWVIIHDRYYFARPVKAGPLGDDTEMNDVPTANDESARIKTEDGTSTESKPPPVDKPTVEKKGADNPPEPTKDDANPGETTDTSNGERTIEDLKGRFYDVGRRMLKLRQLNGETMGAAEDELYKQMKYSKENEVKRKQHLERLLSRSPAEIAEEEALVLESRKLETAAEMMLQERAEILRLLDAPQSSTKITQYQTSQGLAQLTNTLLMSDKGKKRRDTPGSSNTPISGSPPPEGPASPGQRKPTTTAGPKTIQGNKRAAPEGSPADNKHTALSPGAKLVASSDATPSTKGAHKVKKPKDKDVSKKGAAAGAAAVANAIQKKLTAKEEAAYGISYHDKLTTGVYLRSAKLVNYRQAVQGKMNLVLGELGIPPRPVMPTSKVCSKFDALQQSISVLLEAKKQADKLETEIRILKTQKGYPNPSGMMEGSPE